MTPDNQPVNIVFFGDLLMPHALAPEVVALGKTYVQT